jgi:hypothetical protein
MQNRQRDYDTSTAISPPQQAATLRGVDFSSLSHVPRIKNPLTVEGI